MKYDLKTAATSGYLFGLGLVISCASPLSALAATLSLTNVPLATATTTVVKPNLMFILDNSGSMKEDAMPDSMKNKGPTNSSNTDGLNDCFFNSIANGVAYDPGLVYVPPVDYAGAHFPVSQTSFTAALINGFNTASTKVDLSTSFRDAGNGITAQPAFYFKYTGALATPVGAFCYPNSDYTKVVVSSTSGPGTADINGDGVIDSTDKDERQNFANWFSYYRTRLLMMRTASGLAFKDIGDNFRVGFTTISNQGVTDRTTFSFSSPTDGFLHIADFTGGATGHKKKWYDNLYTDTPSKTTPLRGALSKVGRMYAGKLLTGANDPVQYSCQQNFTLLSTDGYWNTGDESSSYGPYQIDGVTAVGNQDGTAERPMYDGTGTANSIWTLTYTRTSKNPVTDTCSKGKKKLQAQPQIGTCTVTTSTGTCTPTNWTNDPNNAAYWANSTCGSYTASQTTPVQQGSAVVTTSTTPGSSDSLADVAMYYYQTDLRVSGTVCSGSISGEDLCVNNVFKSDTDPNRQQHMTTFTLGLGENGLMKYSQSYLGDSSGDYVAVKLGLTASSTECTWQTIGTTCNWPIAVMNKPQAIDDLWHAAVDGRGAYFSASNPTTLAASLSQTLAGIRSRKGSAAAAATSTLNPVAGNNWAYVASYTTLKWMGNLEARGINVDTGAVNTNADWCVEDVAAGNCAPPSYPQYVSAGATKTYYCVTPSAVTCAHGTLHNGNCYEPLASACTGTLKSMVSDTADLRTIKTANGSGTGLVDFYYANLLPSQQAYFSTTAISGLNQWSSLSVAQQSAAADANLVNFLRGQYGHEDRTSSVLLPNRLYRYREAVMGDALESQPTYMANPVFSYSYAGYSAYALAQKNREGMVFIGANDGMMHAFYTQSSAGAGSPCVIGAIAGEHCAGEEAWAYVPSMVMPNLWQLADTIYSTKHLNYVNGTPATSDVYCNANCGGPGGAASWRTILVGGLGSGGRGYYALDITVPNAPTLLWEFTTTAGIGREKDDDVGYAYGRPVITRKADGTWVVLVASGYNNSSPGSGQSYLFVLDAMTGNRISKIATEATSSGLARIAGWNGDPTGNQADYVYGGDLQGNMWRFDINSSTAASIGTGDVLKFATVQDGGGNAQPITTTPVLGKIGGKRVIFFGTGKYLEQADLSTTLTQTYYAIKDDNATATLTNARTALVQQTVSNTSTGTRSISSNAVDFSAKRGWYIDFPDTGERENIDAKLVQGVLIVPTIVPSSTTCSPGGYSWLNYLCYDTGAACGTSAHYDATIVGFNVTYIGGEVKVSVVTSEDPTPRLDAGGGFGGNSPQFQGVRTIWRELPN